MPSLEKKEMCPGQLSIFDFSERKQSNRAATVVHGSSLGELRGDFLCVVARVGDALQEPFWPEGLGTNRGVHNARDAACAGCGGACGTAARRAGRLSACAPVEGGSRAREWRAALGAGAYRWA